MKIAVITPHWNTSVEHLRRNLQSVADQKTEHEVHHFLVADGYDCDAQDACIKEFKNTTHIRLPVDCNDVGATPSVVGMYVARAMGYDAFIGLGDDNLMLPNHIQTCVDKHKETGCDVIASERYFMTQDGGLIVVGEEDNHIDANCYVFFGKAVRYIHMCAMLPRELVQINDRIFYTVFNSRFKIARTGLRTIGYATRWAVHYTAAGLPVPQNAKSNTGDGAKKWIDETPEDVKQDWFDYLFQRQK